MCEDFKGCKSIVTTRNVIIQEHCRFVASGMELLASSGSKISCELTLLHMLSTKGMALNNYDDIINWFRRNAQSLPGHIPTSISFMSRNECIKQVRDRLDLHGITPTQTTIQLPYNAGSIEVTTIDIEQSIYLLPTDKDLMSPENLRFPQNKIFVLPLDCPEVIDDIDTLLLYRAANVAQKLAVSAK